MCDLAPQQHKGLRAAVEELGGSGVFLFLTAKVSSRTANVTQLQLHNIVSSFKYHNGLIEYLKYILYKEVNVRFLMGLFQL